MQGEQPQALLPRQLECLGGFEPVIHEALLVVAFRLDDAIETKRCSRYRTRCAPAAGSFRVQRADDRSDSPRCSISNPFCLRRGGIPR